MNHLLLIILLLLWSPSFLNRNLEPLSWFTTRCYLMHNYWFTMLWDTCRTDVQITERDLAS